MMKKNLLHFVSFIFIVLISCRPQNKESENTAHADTLATTTPDSTLSYDDEAEPQENDCVFDWAEQTDDFVKEVPDFQKYTWIDSTKTAVVLYNNDTINVQRGGCYHYAVSGEWVKKDDHAITDTTYWIRQATWLAERVLPKGDFEGMKMILAEKTYNINIDDDQLSIEFLNHNYTEWNILVKPAQRGADQKISLYTGYWFE